MSCRISVSRWEGDDQTAVIEKIAKMFRIKHGKALEIMNKLGAGVPWRFDLPVSDQQGKEAKAFLASLGFNVALVPAKADNSRMGLGFNPYTEEEDFEEAPIKKGLLARLKEKIANRGKL